MQKFRPGETVPMSCGYRAFSAEEEDGGRLYLEKGETFPPMQHEGGYYIMDHK